jgi:hypothetical protein
MRWLTRLWHEESGFIVSTELVLVATVLLLSTVVGMKKISAQVLAEMSDLGNAIGYLNHTYMLAGASHVAADGSVLASWSGTGVLPDGVDVGAGDLTSIATNVIPSNEL